MSTSKPDWRQLSKTDVHFDVGAQKQVLELVGTRKTLLVTTRGSVTRGTIGAIFDGGDSGRFDLFDRVTPNPSLSDIETAAEKLRAGGYECIVSVGGGSAIDTAKCLSVLLNSGESSLGELIDDSDLLRNIEPIPVIAVPTTSGSGSEVTPFATVWDYTSKKKLSLAAESIMPETAVVDPSLTLSLPLRETLSSGLDAISHAFESVWNMNATPATIAVATDALKLGLSSIAEIVERSDDIDVRVAMSKASLLAGVAISHTRTALAHSASYPLTIHLGVDHGFACSVLLPAILKFNSAGDDGRLAKLTNDLGHRDLEEMAHHVDSLLSALDLGQFLSEFDLSSGRLSSLSGEMVNPQRADNNMREVGSGDIYQILLDTSATLRRLEFRR
jgi:alcohol dehydrogenase